MGNPIIESLFSSEAGERIYRMAASAIDKHKMANMIHRGVLLGFSGGPDSVMLLCVLLKYRERIGRNFPIVACHINHGIRGAEADRDEEFSRALAATLGVEFISAKVDVPSLSREMRVGTEEAARIARYAEFDNILSGRNDIFAIATAHNATDNVETMLFNMCRGSASDGASGISKVRGNIVRPLIYVPKSDIVSALDAAQIEYVTDSTNDSVEYTRNYIRHSILPSMRKLNPKLETAFSNLSDALRTDADFLGTLARDSYTACVRDGKVRREDIANKHPALLSRMLIYMANDKGAELSRLQINKIIEGLSADNFSISVGGGFDFVCERGVCSFRPRFSEMEHLDFKQDLALGFNRVAGFAAAISIGENITVSSSFVYKNSIQADLSSAIIVGGLYVRFRKPGDAYYYGGMTHRLKKVFNDRDIPPSLRDRIPVICDDNGIVWVPGLGVRDDGVDRTSVERLPIFFGVSDDLDGEELYSAKYFEK